MRDSKKVIDGQYYTSAEVCNFMVGLSTKDPANSKVLETGCGEGAFVDALLKSDYKEIVACDIDEENIIQNRLKFGNKAEFRHENFLGTNLDEKFDLIPGNPPYVQWNNIRPEIREMLSTNEFWKQYSNGEWDLLYAFIIWSIEKLRDGGELIYIVPYNWFTSTHGKSLRNYLIDNGRFDVICYFSEFKLFKDCYPNNIVFKYTKTDDKDHDILVSRYMDRDGDVSEIIEAIEYGFEAVEEGPYENDDHSHRIFTMPQFQRDETWYLATPSEMEEIASLESTTCGQVVGDHLDVGVGIVSGYDKAFLLTDEEASKLSAEEKKYVFPFIKAKNCRQYEIEGHTSYIFVDTIKNETELKSLTNIYERLYAHKDGLEERYGVAKKNWWEWATIRNMELFQENLDKPKIFVPCRDRSLHARYSYTNRRVYGSGDALMIAKREGLREDLRYVLAWLNSKMINDWYFIKGSNSGHRILYTQAYVSKVPLLLIDWDDEEHVAAHDGIVEEVQMKLNGDTSFSQSNLESRFRIIMNVT